MSGGLCIAGSSADSTATIGASIAPSTGPTERQALVITECPNGSTSEPLNRAIDRLKDEQARLRAERKRVAKELKNASKRKTRLRKRARQLSNEDLLAVLIMRRSDTQSVEPAATEDAASTRTRVNADDAGED